MHGIDSHGVSNMLPVYVDRLREGDINPNPTMKCTHDCAGTLSFDCDGGLGLARGRTSMSGTLERSRAHGIACVTGYNSSHYGARAYYVHQAVLENLIGISLTTGSLKVAPTFGAERLVGLSPLGLGVPTKNEIPLSSMPR